MRKNRKRIKALANEKKKGYTILCCAILCDAMRENRNEIEARVYHIFHIFSTYTHDNNHHTKWKYVTVSVFPILDSPEPEIDLEYEKKK